MVTFTQLNSFCRTNTYALAHRKSGCFLALGQVDLYGFSEYICL